MKFLRVVCVLCGLLSTGFCLDREAFTFTKYDLTLRLEPEQRRLAVRGTVTLRNDSNSPQKEVSLQLSSSLGWRSIRIADKKIQFLSQIYISDIDHTGALSEAIVTLPQPVPPHGSVELEVGYEGTVALDTTRLTRIGVPKETAADSDWDMINDSFTALRGIGYVAWYPVATEAASLSEGNSLFDTLGRWKAREMSSEMRIHLCRDYMHEPAPTFVSNGMEVAATGSGGMAANEGGTTDKLLSTRCVEYRFQPLGLNVPTFAVADFASVDRPASRVYCAPDHKALAEDFAQAVERAVPFVAGWFGTAQSKAQFVELPDAADSPFDAGATLWTPLARTDPKLAEIAAVHQLTHAAFSSRRPWIYEGLAHFAQAAYRERQDGRQAALDWMAVRRRTISDAQKQLAAEPDSSVRESLVQTHIEEFYRAKAAYVWWMLRDMLGEETIKKVLAEYRTENDKEPSYVQRLLEAQTHRELEWFFDDWVYRDRGLPDFRVESVYPRRMLQGGYLVTVTMENLGAAGAEVPITVKTAEGDSTKRLEVRAKSKNSIRFPVSGIPREAVVNDGSVPESDMGNNTFQVGPPAAGPP